jgi:PPM family protein phosphatase
MDHVKVRASARTDRGLVRDHNEDAFLVAEIAGARRFAEGTVELPSDAPGVLLAVSDGMGGAAAGEVAAHLSLEELLAGMTRVPDACGNQERLQHVIHIANKKVRDAAKRPDRRGMGATLTAVQLCGGTAYVAQIGDSRAYLLREGQITQVTHDQSYVQMLVDAGVLTPEEAEKSPQKNIVTQAMGQKEDLTVDLGRLELRPGDRLLICSDGLSNKVKDDHIRDIASAPAPLEEACKTLIEAAKRAGGDDNITVVLAELGAA